MTINAPYDKEEFATDEECQAHREYLISLGLITPGEPADRFSEAQERGTFHPAPRKKRAVNVGRIPDSGTYKCRPIRTDEQYRRRLQNYFHILQSILQSRARLGVQFNRGRRGE